MNENPVRQELFGKDLGTVHEMVVTGRKIGAGVDFYSGLAHNEELFKEVVNIVRDRMANPGGLFRLVKQVVLPARKKPFVPNQVIVVDNRKVRVSFVGSEIKAIGIAIPTRGPVAIDYRPLAGEASFKDMNEALVRKPMELDSVYGLCLLQPKGPDSPEGVLRTDGWGNLFPRVLIGAEDRAVYVYWGGGGWRFSVYSVARAAQWRVGSLVFSLNS